MHMLYIYLHTPVHHIVMFGVGVQLPQIIQESVARISRSSRRVWLYYKCNLGVCGFIINVI